MINLLPTEEKENIKKGLQMRFVVSLLFFISVSLFVGFVMLLPSYFLISDYFYKTDQSSAVLNQGNESLESTLKIPIDVNEKFIFMQTKIGKISAQISVLKVLEFLPKEITINSISFSRDQIDQKSSGNGPIISISGIAPNRDSLVYFQSLLRNSKDFLSVEMPVSSLAKEKNIPFNMKIFIEEKR